MIGSMAASFDQKPILFVISKMLMKDFDGIDQQVIDAVREIAITITGGVKRELSQIEYGNRNGNPLGYFRIGRRN